MALPSSLLWFILGDLNHGIELLLSLVILYMSYILENTDACNMQHRLDKQSESWLLLASRLVIKKPRYVHVTQRD